MGLVALWRSDTFHYINFCIGMQSLLCMSVKRSIIGRTGQFKDHKPLTHPLISEYASNPLKVLACETAWAKAAIRGARRCSGMLGIRS